MYSVWKNDCNKVIVYQSLLMDIEMRTKVATAMRKVNTINHGVLRFEKPLELGLIV